MQILVSSLRAGGSLSARQLAADSGIPLSTARRWLYQAVAGGDVVPVGLETAAAGKGRAGRLYKLAEPRKQAAAAALCESGETAPACRGIALRAIAARTPLELAWSAR